MRPRQACVTAVAAALVGAAPAAADDHVVTFPTSFAPGAYSPANPEIAANDTVTFNGSYTNHPLVWTDDDFATENSGTSHQYSFLKPGLYRFHCGIHTTTMVGSVHVPGNQFATPDFSVAPAAPQAGQPVSFDASGVIDPDGTIKRYEWDFDGDGLFESTSATAQTQHTYAAAGSFSVALRYVDDGHETSPATTKVVTVAAAPSTGGGGGTTTPPPTGSGGGGTGSTAPTGPTTGVSTTTAPAGAQGVGTASIRVVSRALAFSHGLATLRLRVASAVEVRATLRRGRVVLARGHSHLAAGDRRLRLRLTSAGARRLHHGATKAVLTISAGTGGKALKKTLTVRGG
jgi:plastocyanin